MTVRRKPAPPSVIRSRRGSPEVEPLIDLSQVVAQRPADGETWTEFEARLDADPVLEQTDEEADKDIEILWEERERISSWDEVDIQARLGNGIPPEVEPTLVKRTDGHFLLYRGKVSSVAGPPESAKGWFACEAARQVLQKLEHVYYIDFEDSPDAILRRMLQLGVPTEYLTEFFHVLNPIERFEVHEEKTGKLLWRMLYRDSPGLVVLDGLTQSLANNDLDDNKNTDVVKWFRELPRKIITMAPDAAVLIIDHVTKADDAAKRYALGAGQKLAALDGSQFKAQLIHPFSPGNSGRVRIRVTKDRPGGVRAWSVGDNVEAGQVTTMMELISIDGPEHFVKVKLWPPNQQLRETPDKQVIPQAIMDRMMSIITSPGQEPPNRSLLGRLVTGNSASKIVAINQLIKDGLLIERQENGDSGRRLLYVNPLYKKPKGTK